MTIEQLKKRKQELGYSNEALAEASGVPLGTLQKLFSGATKNPRRSTLLKLEYFLFPEEVIIHKSNASLSSGSFPPAAEYAVKEDPFTYTRGGATAITMQNGEYTLDDYLSLPDDQRVELIDGRFYDMAAPHGAHQAIGGFIYKLLLDHVLAHGGQCMPFMSPIDVQLDRDDRTVVQPDVLILCDRSKFKRGRIFGAPEFLAEVLSPSTRRKDMQLKLYKYGNAGVKEYWLVDMEKEAVVVYDLEHDALPAIYGFNQKVPVLIWNGECEIDFALIWSHISFLLDD